MVLLIAVFEDLLLILILLNHHHHHRVESEGIVTAMKTSSKAVEEAHYCTPYILIVLVIWDSVKCV